MKGQHCYSLYWKIDNSTKTHNMMLTFVKVKYERFQFINDFRTVSMLVMFEFHLKSLELGNRSIYGLELIS